MWIIFVLIVSRSTTASPSESSSRENRVNVEVLRCVDGDTCRVLLAGGLRVDVRLAGLDAPEVGRGKRPGQPYAQEARQFLVDRLVGKSAYLQQWDLDRYHRPVVEIWQSGANINRQLLQAGLAFYYMGNSLGFRRYTYIADEAKARWHRRGLWSLPRHQIVIPSVHRRRSRKR